MSVEHCKIKVKLRRLICILSRELQVNGHKYLDIPLRSIITTMRIAFQASIIVSFFCKNSGKDAVFLVF